MHKRYDRKRNEKKMSVLKSLEFLEQSVLETCGICLDPLLDTIVYGKGLGSLGNLMSSPNNGIPINKVVTEIDWSLLPPALDPTAGELESRRAIKKREQISSLVIESEKEIARRLSQKLDKDRFTVCDFGAGSGHIGLLIAFRNPHIDVVLVERKEYSVDVAIERIKSCGLTNVSIYNKDVRGMFSSPSSLSMKSECNQNEPLNINNSDFFTAGPINISFGVSLHSCGLLTDIALSLCLYHGTKSECCVYSSLLFSSRFYYSFLICRPAY